MLQGTTICIAAAWPILVAWGAWRGARRLLTVAIGATAGACAAPRLGPIGNDLLSAWSDWDTWAGTIASWLVAYASVSLLTFGLLARLFPDPPLARRDRAFRLRGAGVGAVAGGLLAWATVGNLPELALETLPAEGPTAAVELRKPFELLQACRTFSSLSAAEAEQIARRPEVLGVLDSRAMEKLLRTPGMLRKFSRAAEGDWSALGSLANDEAVKTAMRDVMFLERVRRVDVLAMADDIERRRADGTAPHTESFDVATLPAFTRDPEFQAQLQREWSSEATEAKHIAAKGPELAPPELDRAAKAEAYWRSVTSVLEWADRPRGPAALVPHMLPSIRPEEPPAAAAAQE